MMVTLLDIGNTNVDIGLWDGESVVQRERIWTKEISSLSSTAYLDNQAIVICSVVPYALESLKTILRDKDTTAYIIGEDIKVPIQNHYQVPSEVGADRLVCSYIASRLYGKPVVVIDLGTAITFDVVEETGAYRGGIILPGIRSSVEGLCKNAALLPKQLDLSRERLPEVIGRTTKESMYAGIYYGYSGLLDNLITRIREEIGDCPVVGTGGDVQLIKGLCQIDFYKKDLILEGLAMLYAQIEG